jgi:hypothetical protein
VVDVGEQIQPPGVELTKSGQRGSLLSQWAVGFIGVLLGALLVSSVERQKPEAPVPVPGTAPKVESDDAVMIKGLTNDVVSLRDAVVALQRDSIQFSSVLLDPTSKAFSRIDANNGTFYILIDNSKPYLNGQQISVRIGNPQHVTFRGFELSMVWGDPDPQTFKLKDKTETFLTTLYPGTWTRVQTVLAPATGGEVQKGVRFTMKTSEVFLSER